VTNPDNFHFDITGAPLEEALAIAFLGAAGGVAAAWRAEQGDGTPRLILAWSDQAEGFQPLPAAIDAAGAAPLIVKWLRDQDYGPEPDIDGSVAKGWRVYCDSWGKVDGHAYSFVAIEPVWNLYGK
jgi:hypothetical protein